MSNPAHRGLLKDPRFRSRFNSFLKKKTTRRAVPGLDLNRGQQGLNAARGRSTFRAHATPRTGQGQRLQQFLRNRSNEQGGTGVASQPTQPVLPATPQRRY